MNVNITKRKDRPYSFCFQPFLHFSLLRLSKGETGVCKEDKRVEQEGEVVGGRAKSPAASGRRGGGVGRDVCVQGRNYRDTLLKVLGYPKVGR
jgi:hypothetical protein